MQHRRDHVHNMDQTGVELVTQTEAQHVHIILRVHTTCMCNNGQHVHIMLSTCMCNNGQPVHIMLSTCMCNNGQPVHMHAKGTYYMYVYQWTTCTHAC